VPSVVAEVGSTANNYQVLAKLATGGMAEIFLARGASAAGVERYVVLKRILRERATDANFVQMFLEEARLAAQLNHPHVAQVFDIGKLGDSYFFTMEYVHGETVRALLHRARSLRREIPLGNILTVIANAASGLHHAHERIGMDGRALGIVHRDVSPSNLMISYEGSVKVVDFGVAKAENRASETRSGTVKGKISYLSPEQCRGAPVDRRSDLFSLGIVFWEMLTTERLYRRTSDFENMHAIVTEPPPPPSSRRPGLSPEIDAIALRLLSKTVEERFQTADELIEALENASARNNAIMSSAGLSRFLRELFGQRPEPWIEMEQREAPEGVTVTSEPIPPELIAKLDPVDMSLARVRDLSAQQMSTSQSQQSKSPLPPGAQPPPQMMPAPMPTPSNPIPHDLPTLRQRPSSEAIDTNVRMHPSSSSPPLTQPGRPTMPVAVPPMPVPQQHSGSLPSYPVAQQAWLAPPVDVHNQPADSPRSNKVLFAVIAIAILLGVIITVVATRGGDSNATKTPPDAAVAQIVVIDATVAPVIDATVAPVIDAAVAVVQVDAAPAPAIVVDAAVAMVVDAAPKVVDAAVKVAVVDAAPRPLSLSEKIKLAFDEGRFSDTVAACSERVPSDRAAMCTQAACQLGEASKAKAWLPKVSSSKRNDLIAACKQNGVDLVPRVVRPKVDAGVVDCVKEPMACQR
jgi:serine/threonine protein kinase